MTGEFTLNSPLTKEDWDKLSDAELEHTEKILFVTPSGKKVEYMSMSVIENIKAEIKEYANDQYSEDEYISENAILYIIDKHMKRGE